MAEIEGEEDGALTGRQGSDLGGRNGNVWIPSQEQWKPLEDCKWRRDYENGAGIGGSTVSWQKWRQGEQIEGYYPNPDRK